MNFNKWINELRYKNKYDPRPDIKEDSWLWNNVLKTAEKIDGDIYGILHGFRCAGCMLKLKNNHITLKPNIGQKKHWKTDKEWKRDREEWLIPKIESIKVVFSTVEKYLNDNTYTLSQILQNDK